MTRIEQVVREIETPDGLRKEPQVRYGGAVTLDPMVLAEALNLPADAIIHAEMNNNGGLVISFECYRWPSEVTQENRPTYLGLHMMQMALRSPHSWDRIEQIEFCGIKTHRMWQIEQDEMRVAQ